MGARFPPPPNSVSGYIPQQCRGESVTDIIFRIRPGVAVGVGVGVDWEPGVGVGVGPGLPRLHNPGDGSVKNDLE